MSKIITYKVEDIFEDIEGDPDNVNMNIPPEISERMGWTEGDILKITVEDGQISISKKEPDVKE
jgi:AbrB family looped-hinge helix DNA binding protein